MSYYLEESSHKETQSALVDTYINSLEATPILFLFIGSIIY